jgi:Putative zinc-finger
VPDPGPLDPRPRRWVCDQARRGRSIAGAALRREPSCPACEQARSQISLLLDDVLSKFEQARLETHLASCAACRAYETEVVAFTRLARTTPLQPLALSIALPLSRRSSLLGKQAVLTAAAIAVLRLGGLLGIDSRHPAARLHLEARRTSHATAHFVRPAYLDSADYERRLIEQARDWHERWRSGKTIAL